VIVDSGGAFVNNFVFSLELNLKNKHSRECFGRTRSSSCAHSSSRSHKFPLSSPRDDSCAILWTTYWKCTIAQPIRLQHLRYYTSTIVLKLDTNTQSVFYFVKMTTSAQCFYHFLAKCWDGTCDRLLVVTRVISLLVLLLN